MTDPTDDDLLQMCAEITGWQKHTHEAWLLSPDGWCEVASDLNAAFLVAVIVGASVAFRTKAGTIEVVVGEECVVLVCGKSPASAARALLVCLWKARTNA